MRVPPALNVSVLNEKTDFEIPWVSGQHSGGSLGTTVCFSSLTSSVFLFLALFYFSPTFTKMYAIFKL